MPDTTSGSTSLLDDYLSEEEFAAEVNRSVKTIKRWRRMKEGPPYIRIGQEVFYHRPVAASWLKSLETA